MFFFVFFGLDKIFIEKVRISIVGRVWIMMEMIDFDGLYMMWIVILKFN